MLKTPREVRNALAYVLLNTNHHGVQYVDGRDPCSSGSSFDGWKDAKDTGAESRPGFLARARTWLLRIGWRRHGLIPLRA